MLFLANLPSRETLILPSRGGDEAPLATPLLPTDPGSSEMLLNFPVYGAQL